LIDFLHHRARPFLFSTSHPPAVPAACLAAFDIMEQEPERIEQLWKNTRFFQEGLRANGFSTGATETPITPIMVGEAATAHAFSRALFEEGLFATGIGFPTVAEERLGRTIATVTHSRRFRTAIEIHASGEADEDCLEGKASADLHGPGPPIRTPDRLAGSAIRSSRCNRRVASTAVRIVEDAGTPRALKTYIVREEDVFVRRRSCEVSSAETVVGRKGRVGMARWGPLARVGGTQFATAAAMSFRPQPRLTQL
jgi:hypothetical protein